MRWEEFRNTEHVGMGLRKAKLGQNGGWGGHVDQWERLVKAQ